MILGIDASTAGSGGAKRHLTELLLAFDPAKHGFEKIMIWGVTEFLNQLPERSYIIKVSDPWLNKGFLRRILWQLFLRDRSFKNKFDMLLSVFGTYTGSIRPYVTMSRNMLIFDASERRRFGFSLLRFKLKLLFYTQKKSFENADGIIFLSKFAKESIESQTDLSMVEKQIIHHGISHNFIKQPALQNKINEYNKDHPFRFLYVSTIWVYKHPWNVVEAIANLREKGYHVVLDIVGNEEQLSAGQKLQDTIQQFDPDNTFVTWKKKVGQEEVVNYYHSADAFIFASTCENMPNILIEAMSSGLPIACSSYLPMPEFLGDAGLYFDPLYIKSIEQTLQILLLDPALRYNLANKAYQKSKTYTWQKCADETFQFLSKTVKK